MRPNATINRFETIICMGTWRSPRRSHVCRHLLTASLILNGGCMKMYSCMPEQYHSRMHCVPLCTHLMSVPVKNISPMRWTSPQVSSFSAQLQLSPFSYFRNANIGLRNPALVPDKPEVRSSTVLKPICKSNNSQLRIVDIFDEKQQK